MSCKIQTYGSGDQCHGFGCDAKLPGRDSGGIPMTAQRVRPELQA